MLATQFRSGRCRVETGPPMGDEPRLGGLVIEAQAALLHGPPAVESGRVDDRLDGQPGRPRLTGPAACPARPVIDVERHPGAVADLLQSRRDQPVLEVERTRGRSHEPAPAVGPSRQPGHRVVDPARGRRRRQVRERGRVDRPEPDARRRQLELGRRGGPRRPATRRTTPAARRSSHRAPRPRPPAAPARRPPCQAAIASRRTAASSTSTPRPGPSGMPIHPSAGASGTVNRSVRIGFSPTSNSSSGSAHGGASGGHLQDRQDLERGGHRDRAAAGVRDREPAGVGSGPGDLEDAADPAADRDVRLDEVERPGREERGGRRGRLEDLAAGQRDRELPGQRRVGRVIVGRQRFLEPAEPEPVEHGSRGGGSRRGNTPRCRRPSRSSRGGPPRPARSPRSRRPGRTARCAASSRGSHRRP